MAGVGFRLRKLFEHDTFLDDLRGVFFSSSIAGGPIFFSILCLILLGLLSTPFLPGDQFRIFIVTIVYIVAFSLISTGLTQLLITRYLSDLIFVHDEHLILPTFSGVLAITVFSQLFIGTPVLFFWDIDWFFKGTALMLFVAIGCIWQLMIFLSAVKNYRVVLLAFVAGLATSLVLALVLGRRHGLPGFLHGYAIGQIGLMFVLLGRVVIEFRSEEKPDFQFLRYFKLMPQLAVIGLCYNLGIWIDKILFWYSDAGEQVSAFLHAYSAYDGANFFAFLTVVPSYTYFLVKVETEFYGYFRAFFLAILNKEIYQQIVEQKRKVAASLRESFLGLVKLQGAVTLLCLLFSRQIAEAFHIPVMGTLILEKALIAACLQMVLLTAMIFMMYFDIRNQTAVVAGVFVVANVVFTAITLQLGYVYYGYGYLAACLVALAVAYVFLDRHVQDLDYHTFMGQPIAN